jgi:hypothetical protein
MGSRTSYVRSVANSRAACIKSGVAQNDDCQPPDKQIKSLAYVGLLKNAVKLQRAHWESVKGKPTNAYMKDAGRKAAATRAAKGIGRDNALKAVATRRANGPQPKLGTEPTV